MTEKERKVIVTDRELEIQRVQALMTYFQTKINFLYSYMIAFIIGFVIFLGTIYYEGYFFSVFDNFHFNLFAERVGGIVLFGVVLLIFMVAVIPILKEINEDNDRCLKIVDDAFIKIDKGIPLPSLMELKKLAFPKKKYKWLKLNQSTEQIE